jgi:hypothetical protein
MRALYHADVPEETEVHTPSKQGKKARIVMDNIQNPEVATGVGNISLRMQNALGQFRRATEKATEAQQALLSGAQALLLEYSRPSARALDALVVMIEVSATVVEEYSDNIRDLAAGFASAAQTTRVARDVRGAWTMEQVAQLGAQLGK